MSAPPKRAPRQVIVDDTDEDIKYQGFGWFLDNGTQDPVGNFGPTFQSTSHGTKSNGSLSLSFSGQSDHFFLWVTESEGML